MKTSEVMTDVLLYSLFLVLLLMVAYGHRDPIAYEMTRNLENRLSLSVRHLFCHSCGSDLGRVVQSPSF